MWTKFSKVMFIYGWEGDINMKRLNYVINVYMDEELYSKIEELSKKLQIYSKSRIIRYILEGLFRKYSTSEVTELVLLGAKGEGIRRVYDCCNGLTAKEIANETRLAVPTVHQHLRKLIKMGLVVKRGKRYYKREIILEYYKTIAKEKIEWWKRELEMAKRMEK